MLRTEVLSSVLETFSEPRGGDMVGRGDGNTLMVTRSQPNGGWGRVAVSCVAQEESTSVVVCGVELFDDNDVALYWLARD